MIGSAFGTRLSPPFQYPQALFLPAFGQKAHHAPRDTSVSGADLFYRYPNSVEARFGQVDMPLGNIPLDQRIEDAVFVVLDLEATRFDGDIIEVSALKYRNGQVIDRFNSLVKPREPIAEVVVNLTHITDEMVANAPDAPDVLRRLAAFVGESPIVVGHNVEFDIKALREAYDRHGMPELKDRFTLERAFCTCAVANQVLTELKTEVKQAENGHIFRDPNTNEPMMRYPKGTLKLGAVAEYLGISNEGAHRAEIDVRMCANILYCLIERLREEGKTMSTLRDLWRFQGPPVLKREKPEYGDLIAYYNQALGTRN